MNKIHCLLLNVFRVIFSLEVNGIGCFLNDVSNLCARGLGPVNQACTFSKEILIL